MTQGYSIRARASATVANQPTFDGGGFAVQVVRTLGGESEPWETLYDEVVLSSEGKKNSSLTIHNHVEEPGVPALSTEPERHTGGRIILALLRYGEEKGRPFGYDLTLEVKKGLSLRGTGLGSSGATPAATLKAFEALAERLDYPLSLSEGEKAAILKDADFGVPDNSIPAYYGGLTLIETKSGESQLSIRTLKKSPRWGTMVLVTPKGFGIKTEEARRALSGKNPPTEEAQWKEAAIKAFEAGDMESYGQWMERVHAWFVGPRRRLYPREGEVYDQFVTAAKTAGAVGVTISGAGPTVLALVPAAERQWPVAQAMREAFRSSGFDSIARAVEINEQGAQILV